MTDIYPLELITPSKQWEEISRAIKKAQDSFMHVEPYEISPAAKQILAQHYTPQGRLFEEFLEEINKQNKEVSNV